MTPPSWTGSQKSLLICISPSGLAIPRDIIQHICWKAKYEGKQPLFTLDAIREACDSYFLWS